MASMPQTKHHCTISADKEFTSFKWCLTDWSLLCTHYNDVVSPEFLLHNMNGKTCVLNFKKKSYDSSSIDIQFPMGIQYFIMKIKWCILDENSVSLWETTITRQNGEQSCKLNSDFHYNRKDFSDYLRNDSLTLFFEFEIVKSVKTSALRTDIWSTDCSTDMCKNFKVILDSKYDVTFVVRGKKLYAHKDILVANSDVFRAMFTTEMKELEDRTVEIVDTDSAVFESFLSYMYTGRVSEIENVIEELIVVADKYQVMNLKTLCECYMLNHIDDNNVVLYLLKAYQLCCNDLQKCCIHFVRANMHILGNSADLVKLSEYPSIVSQIFDNKPTDKLMKQNTDLVST